MQVARWHQIRLGCTAVAIGVNTVMKYNANFCILPPGIRVPNSLPLCGAFMQVANVLVRGAGRISV